MGILTAVRSRLRSFIGGEIVRASGLGCGARNSLFTTTLIEAFGGATVNRGDSLVGVLDLFTYVSTEVPKRADQHPIFHAGGVDANFAIARRRAKFQPKSLDTNALNAIFATLYPQGPIQDDLWARAGGDVHALCLAAPAPHSGIPR